MVLYKHNKATYEKLEELFTVGNKAAVVQPTGTGKSFVMLQLISDNQNKVFLVCSPSTYIFSQIKGHAAKNGVQLNNCQFLTYSKIALMSETEHSTLAADYIILDEFHRCGAAEWGRGIELLLSTNPSAKLLGTSATPIRYLDSMRDMAQELFDGNYAVNMSLADAIRLKILPLPVYITAIYSFAGEIARLEKRAEYSGNQFLKRKLLGKIQKAKSMISELDCGAEKIFQRHIKEKDGKYIVFCTDTERLHDAFDEADNWFGQVNPQIHKYKVYSANSASNRQFEEFRDDSSDALKLLFCVDMLNEGVHVDGIDGVIMLRATKSANVFYQQLGRALSCSSGTKPIIFDIVNNFETGDTAKQYSEIMNIGRINGESDGMAMQFELYDYVRDIRDILDELNKSFSDSWDLVYDELADFVRIYNHFPAYNEEYDGYKLGVWCSNQRVLKNGSTLSLEQQKKLDELGFVWDAKNERWETSYAEVCRYIEQHGILPSRTDKSENAALIYQWVSNQKQAFKRGELSDSRVKKLNAIGIELEVKSDDELWEEKYALLKEFLKTEKRFPVVSDIEINPKIYPVCRWMTRQKFCYKNGILSDERKEKLTALGFVWNKADALWEQRFEVLKRFVSENRRYPMPREKLGSDTIGQWYYKQRKKAELGELDEDKLKRLMSVCG